MTEAPRMQSYGPIELGSRNRQRIENYVANMQRPRLARDVRRVIDDIVRQYRETGWLSMKQIDVLRRCCLASNSGNRMGGFSQGPCFGRNAPAGRHSGPVG